MIRPLIIRPLIDRRLSLGHSVIDAEHAAIGNFWLRAVSCGRLEFPLHLARLRKAMTRHFEHEAELMAEAGGSLCTRHHAEHRSLLNLCADASALYERDWRKTQSLLRVKLAKMIREHITSMDQCAVLIMHTSDARVCGPMTLS